ALHVRVQRFEGRFDLLVTRLQGVDLRGDQRALLAYLLLLALLVVDAVPVCTRGERSRPEAERDDERHCATDVSATVAHGEGSSRGTAIRIRKGPREDRPLARNQPSR